jgi:hypothetical protein
MNHFLFVAGALRERTSQESAECQLSAGIWGLRTALIADNLKKFVTVRSHGLVYVLKMGICADFIILSPVLPFTVMDEFLRDDMRTEARFGFVRIEVGHRWNSSTVQCQMLLQQVLNIPEQAEFNRRLSLGMHRLTELEYGAITNGLSKSVSGDKSWE